MEFNKIYIEGMLQIKQLSSSSIEDDEMKNGYSLINNYKNNTQKHILLVSVFPF